MLKLTKLYTDSEYSLSQEEATLHFEADNPSNSITKAELREISQQFAHGLRSHYGIGASGPYKDVVVVMAGGDILAPATFYGVIAAGGVFSPASPSFKPPELARHIKQGMSNLIICTSDKKGTAIEAAKLSGVPLSRVLVLESTGERSLKSIEGYIDCRSNQRIAWRKIVDPQELKDSLVLLLYSSGTTGVPKGSTLLYQPSVLDRG
jgi:4-coumarate--CoA ligase